MKRDKHIHIVLTETERKTLDKIQQKMNLTQSGAIGYALYRLSAFKD